MSTKTTGKNNCDGNSDAFDSSLDSSASEIFPGEKYVPRRARQTKKDKDEKQRDGDESPKETINSYTKSENSSMIPKEEAKSLIRWGNNSFQGIRARWDDDPMTYADSKYIKSNQMDHSMGDLSMVAYKDDPEDPLAGAFSDEFEDELDDIELKRECEKTLAKLGSDRPETTSLRRSPRCRIGTALLVCFLLLVAVISGAVLLVGKEDSSAENDDQDNRGNIPLADVSLLEAYCSNSEFQVNGPQNCIDYCLKADCCWRLGVTTCASTDQCRDYTEHCTVLNTNGYLDSVSTLSTSSTATAMIPDSSDELNEVCSKVKAQQGTGVYRLDPCQHYCEKAECCWKIGTESCTSPSSVVDDHVCRDYIEACAFLNTVEQDDESNSATATKGTGLSVESSPPSSSPPPTQAPTTTVVVPKAPSTLGSICSRQAFQDPVTGGQTSIECETECFKATCCWMEEQPSNISSSSNSTTSCLDNPECPAYVEPCSILLPLFQQITGSGSDTTSSSNAAAGSPMNRRRTLALA